MSHRVMRLFVVASCALMFAGMLSTTSKRTNDQRLVRVQFPLRPPHTLPIFDTLVNLPGNTRPNR
jgi:hypothetical protein